jgi:hypothetical protein
MAASAAPTVDLPLPIIPIKKIVCSSIISQLAINQLPLCTYYLSNLPYISLPNQNNSCIFAPSKRQIL